MDLTPESYKQMLDHLGEAVYFVDPERRILYWNHAAELLTGYGAAELVGRLCADGPLHHVDEKNTPCASSTVHSNVVSTAVSRRKNWYFWRTSRVSGFR